MSHASIKVAFVDFYKTVSIAKGTTHNWKVYILLHRHARCKLHHKVAVSPGFTYKLTLGLFGTTLFVRTVFNGAYA